MSRRRLERERLPARIKQHGEGLASMGVPSDSIEAMEKCFWEEFLTRVTAEVIEIYRSYCRKKERAFLLSKHGLRHFGVAKIALSVYL